MPNRIGLKDIAKSLGISVTTVSRALNDKLDINAKTKQAVLDKAAELNYRPNAYAISLRKNEYYSIGVILPTIDHYFFSTVLKGIMNKAHQANYLVIIGESAHDLEKEKEILEQFVSHCVTGVIISPSNKSTNSDNLSLLRKKRIPFVLVDRPLNNDQDSCVKYDDPNGAFLAVEHLINQGFKRIAFLRGHDYCIISNARFEGYKLALAKYDIPFRQELVKKCFNLDYSEDGYINSRELLLSPNPPDAFFTVTDNVALGIYKSAEELKFQIGKDIGLVGYSNSEVAAHLKPKLSTVEQPGFDMGAMAFDYLQQTIIGNPRVLKKTFDARLIIRESSLRHITPVLNPQL